MPNFISIRSGVLILWGSNFWLFHEKEKSPLTHGLNYAVQPVMRGIVPISSAAFEQMMIMVVLSLIKASILERTLQPIIRDDWQEIRVYSLVCVWIGKWFILKLLHSTAVNINSTVYRKASSRLTYVG